jgi:hypothetical protein
MKKYIVIYTTPANTAARHVATVTAADYSKAYIRFILDHPRGYIITDLQEVIKNGINL